MQRHLREGHSEHTRRLCDLEVQNADSYPENSISRPATSAKSKKTQTEHLSSTSHRSQSSATHLPELRQPLTVLSSDAVAIKSPPSATTAVTASSWARRTCSCLVPSVLQMITDLSCEPVATHPWKHAKLRYSTDHRLRTHTEYTPVHMQMKILEFTILNIQICAFAAARFIDSGHSARRLRVGTGGTHRRQHRHCQHVACVPHESSLLLALCSPASESATALNGHFSRGLEVIRSHLASSAMHSASECVNRVETVLWCHLGCKSARIAEGGWGILQASNSYGASNSEQIAHTQSSAAHCRAENKLTA